MPGPSLSELRQAERRIRRHDRALRLRYSLEQPGTILIERKTFRGRIGSVGPGGLTWTPDAGYRREWGHLPVASVRAEWFDPVALEDALKAADTWRRWDADADPLWKRVEDAEERERAARWRRHRDTIRYKASELFDRYVWRYKQRVSVPVQVE